MIIRIVPLLALSVVLNAQTNAVNFEIHAKNFPKNSTLQIEMKLRYFAIDMKNIISEGRKTPVKKDYLIDQISNNTHKWHISFNEKGEAIFNDNPQPVAFVFPKPVHKLNNAQSYIKPEGSLTILVDGKPFKTMRLAQLHPFQSGVILAYLFQSEKNSEDSKFSMSLLSKEKLKDAMESKLQRSQTPGIVNKPTTK